LATLAHFLILSAALVGIGIYGLVAKRNAVRMVFAIEILINAANINFVAFTRFFPNPAITGQAIALFVIALAAAEVAVGLAIIIVLFRLHRDIDILELKTLRR
jgi:NADH:ubiquinone oxidoreductase subunit K